MDDIRIIQDILNENLVTDEENKKIEEILEKLTENAISQYYPKVENSLKLTEEKITKVPKALNIIMVLTFLNEKNLESKIIVCLPHNENFYLNEKVICDSSTSLCFCNIDGKVYAEEIDPDELVENSLFKMVNEQNVLDEDVYHINEEKIQIIDDKHCGFLFKLNSNAPLPLESWENNYQGVNFTKSDKLWMIKDQNKRMLKQYLKSNEKHYVSSKTKLEWNKKTFKIFYYHELF